MSRENMIAEWESRLDSHDRSRLDEREVQAVCDYVWSTLSLPGRSPVARRVASDSRLYVDGVLASVEQSGAMRTYYEVNTVTVLHEIAHQLTDDPLAEMELRPVSEREVHGPTWLSNYLFLLDYFMPGPTFSTFRLRGTMPRELSPESLPFYPTVWGQPRPDLVRRSS